MSVVDIIGEEILREVLADINAELREKSLPRDEKASIRRQKKIISRLYKRKLRKERNSQQKASQTLI